jgi:hypothetical protein
MVLNSNILKFHVNGRVNHISISFLPIPVTVYFRHFTFVYFTFRMFCWKLDWDWDHPSPESKCKPGKRPMHRVCLFDLLYIVPQYTMQMQYCRRWSKTPYIIYLRTLVFPWWWSKGKYISISIKRKIDLTLWVMMNIIWTSRMIYVPIYFFQPATDVRRKTVNIVWIWK